MDTYAAMTREQLAEALHSSESRFDEAVQNAHHILYRLNVKQGGYDYLSPYLEELTGHPLALFKQIKLDALPDYFHPDDRERIFGEQGELARAIHRQVDGKTFLQIEYRLRKSDGSYCWLRDQISIIFGADGEIEAFVGAAYDITIEKEREAQLKASEQTFSTLFSTMREGFAFHEVICNAAGEVIDYRYLDINLAFEQLTGLKRENTVGRTVREVLPGIEEKWIQCFGNVALTGIPDERESYVQDLDRYYQARAYSPLKGTFAVVFEETTAQRRAQRELERREALYNDLVETATDLVWRCDSEGRYIFLNRSWEKAFGYHIDEMLGHRFTDFMTSEQAERDSAIFAQVLATSGQVTGYETIHLRKDGTPVYLVFNASYFHDDAGQIIGTQGTAHDISVRKQMDDTLRLSEENYRTISSLTSDFIHKCTRSGSGPFCIQWIGGAAYSITGYHNEEIMAKGCWLPFVHPDDRQHVADYLFSLAPGDRKQTEFRLITKKGDICWISETSYCNAGAIAGELLLFGAVTDITGRKRAAEELAVAYQRLAESENLYRSLFEQSPDGIQLTDPVDTRPIYFNTAMHWQLGYTREEYASLKVSDYEELESPEQIAARIAAMRETGSATFESVYRTKQGDLRNVLVSLQMITVGDKPRILAIIRDITERKQVEEAIRSSEERFRSIMENIPSLAVQGYWLDGTVHFWNRASEFIYGFTAEEAVGNNLFDLIIPAEMQAGVRAAVRHMAATGEPIPASELSLQRKDGSRVAVFSSHALFQPVGRPAELFCLDIDLTEQKAAQLALVASEERFRSTMALSPDIISIIGADGSLQYNSPAALQIHGYTNQEMIGLNTFDLVHPDDRVAVGEAFREIMQQPSMVGTVQYRYRNKDGSYAWMECSANNQLANPHINGVIAISRNIDARKAMEEERHKLERQLLHAQKLESLGVLAGGIAHDFNNIIMAIMGNADLALMRINKESPAVDNLRRIEQASARAADLAKQMLAYSGKGKFVVEQIDLNRLVEEMLHMLEVSISKKALLRFNLSSPLHTVEADATQLRQIIMNLVINASEAIGDRSGVIAISTGCQECSEKYLQDVWLADPIPEGRYVFLEVADTGCGMDSETLAKLFDPFFSTKFTGRGLGMAAVLGIVRGHKGAIKVYSKPGKGTTFKVLLPAVDRPAEIFNGQSHTGEWKGSGTVLLVDDEETVRAIGGEMLRELGFQVVTAEDGRDAVEVFKSHLYIDFVILDLTMPHMDGEQTFRELRQLDPNVKVIMCSGFSESEVTQKFAGRGMAGFIQKPYKLSDLWEALRRIVAPSDGV